MDMAVAVVEGYADPSFQRGCHGCMFMQHRHKLAQLRVGKVGNKQMKRLQATGECQAQLLLPHRNMSQDESEPGGDVTALTLSRLPDDGRSVISWIHLFARMFATNDRS